MSETAPARTRRAGLGAATLIGSLVPGVWILVLFTLVGAGGNTESVDNGLIVASFIVLPVLSLAVIVLAIAAFIVNNWIGRVLAALGLAILLLQSIALAFAITVFG